MTFEEECIEALNSYRRRHSADALQVKEELTRNAQDFAKRLALGGKLRHSKGMKYGENVAVTKKKKPSGDDIASAWYNEIAKYDFSNPGPVPGTGQFTQVVWKGTTHVGVGFANSANGTFVVANFQPIGNIVNPGHFEKNVLPLEGSEVQTPSISSVNKDIQMNAAEPQPQDGVQEETFEEVTKNGNIETHTLTTVKKYTDPNGRRMKETTKVITTTTTKNGRKSTTKKTGKTVEFETDGALRSKTAK